VSRPAAKFLHARELLLCDAWAWDEPRKMAAALGITSRAVEHLKPRLEKEGLAAALGRKALRKPREAIFEGEFNARLTALACSQTPAGYQRRTVRLLADKLVELKMGNPFRR
jgi:hypothetical protein